MNYIKFYYIGPCDLMRCPRCGYYAFNGYECFDCGYRRR